MVNKEKINEFADGAAKLFEKAKIGVTKAYTKVNKEANLIGMRNELGKFEAGLGKICYDLIQQDKLSADNKDVKIYVDRIARIKSDIDKLENGYFVCLRCGNLHENGTEYCPKTGEKIFK